VRLVERINPTNEAGRITLITRFGAREVERLLPPLIEAIERSEMDVLWSVDPMHAQTMMTRDGFKTRDFDAILTELTTTFRIHGEVGSHLGGVHFELTGDDVTECIGGRSGVTEADLSRQYESYCDPRLNRTQSIEMAEMIANLLGPLPKL